MNKCIWFILLSFVWIGGVVGQNAERYVHKLCASCFHGRGYYRKGHLKAARWIAKQFESKGLEPLTSASYFQSFEFACAYLTSAVLKLNGKRYRVGYEFLPDVRTKPMRVSYVGEVLNLGDGVPEKGNYQSRWILIDERLAEKDGAYSSLEARIAYWLQQGVGGILVRTSKLTHRFGSQWEYTVPVIYVLDSLCPETIHSVELKLKGRRETIRSQNVCGYMKGTSDSVVILGAHYDHLGQIGKTIFWGANDNASGVALLLTLLDSLNQRKTKPSYSLLFIAFGAEEAGLIGSFFYVKHPLVPLNRVKWMFNFDLWGYGEEGVMMENGDQDTVLYSTFQQWSEASFHGTFPIKVRKNAPNSDHFPFTLVGVPAYFFYALGGKPYYHDPYDAPDQLTLYGLPKMVSLVLKLVAPMP
jgi:hypothetical protein